MQRKEKDNQLIFIDYLIFSRQKATTDSALLSPQVGMRRLERPTPTSRT